ncbi:MAG: 23S rRNA (guanosine(2251)-2'-O)-methyltransferase RlmB [Chitinophagaceae bacterium]|nr:MAG: 23S rRNA (guanosine(2251)-2'-O)-methyltransferase RlmB [Chitinophagaceae bacterium]
MLLAGRTAILKALEEGQSLDRIFLQKNAPAQLQGEMRKVSEKHGVPVNYVPVEKLNGYNAGDHGGCIALISRVQYQDLQQVISWVVEKGETPLFVILDGITDIRNIGGIARTAWSMGVHALVIPDKGVGALNEDAMLTSAGALEQITVCRVNSLMKAVDEMRLNGIRVLASEMEATTTVFDIDFKEPTAIVMGGEERGIHPALRKICDEQFRIPMPTEFESLNVSVATGMILYEAMKQRTQKS